MGQYIYSGALRRSAREVLARAGAPLMVGVVGGGHCEHMLFRSAGTVVPLSPGDVSPDWVSRCDAILCRGEDLAEVDDAIATNANVKMLAVRCAAHGAPSAIFMALATLAERLGLVLISEQSDALDFGRDKELCFVMARPAATLLNDPLGLLKTAVVLEAHSLHSAATEYLLNYNQSLPAESPKLAVALDCAYEVIPFVTGDRTALAHSNAAISRVLTEQDSVDARLLSVHFDLLHKSDGGARLRRLANSLALPQHVEIVVRVDKTNPPPPLPELTQTIMALGIQVKIFEEAEVPGWANPCSTGFLASTAPEARLAVYLGNDREPGMPGWDYDLLRTTAIAEGSVFALKMSDHKTRYYAAPEDAEAAPEDVPAVSRALAARACETWSVPGVPAEVFQALVAFYFGRVDWTNKHRLLRLYPVMAMQITQPETVEAQSSNVYRRFRRTVVGTAAERHALRAALVLQALEWSAQHGLVAPELEYDDRRQRLVLREQGDRHSITRQWLGKLDRSRLPL